MTWLWGVPDLRLRIRYARDHGPTDFFTLLARYIVFRVNKFIALVLRPVDLVAQLFGKIMLVFVLGLMLLLALTMLWFPFWCMMVGSSYAWLKYPWSRPILILPGMLLTFVLTAFLMLVPDPKKHPRYVAQAQEWPLTYRIWKPEPAYYRKHDLDDPDSEIVF